MKTISIITICALLIAVQEGRASDWYNAQTTLEEISVQCVAQCNGYYYRERKVSSFDKGKFDFFSKRISDTPQDQRASRCEDLANALKAVEARNKSALAGSAKSCISYLTQKICNWTPESLQSCHEQCKKILNDSCAVHLQ